VSVPLVFSSSSRPWKGLGRKEAFSPSYVGGRQTGKAVTPLPLSPFRINAREKIGIQNRSFLITVGTAVVSPFISSFPFSFFFRRKKRGGPLSFSFLTHSKTGQAGEGILSPSLFFLFSPRKKLEWYRGALLWNFSSFTPHGRGPNS